MTANLGLPLVALLALSCVKATRPPVELFLPLSESCVPGCTPCFVQLGTVTDFAWDRALFIRKEAGSSLSGGRASVTAAAAAVGLSEVIRKEFDDLVVFVRDGREVERLIRTYDPEAPLRRTVFLRHEPTEENWYWNAFGPLDWFRFELTDAARRRRFD